MDLLSNRTCSGLNCDTLIKTTVLFNKYTGLDLHTPVFSHNQLYTLLSLAHPIYVIFPETKNGTSTINAAYPEVLY